jgi:formylglycine-generating enzyme required for sulfatase activity
MKKTNYFYIILLLLSLVLQACNNQSQSSENVMADRWGDKIEDSSSLNPLTLDLPLPYDDSEDSSGDSEDSQSYNSSSPIVEGLSFTNFLGMKMKWVDGGQFIMGRTESEKRMKVPVNGTWPLRKVTVKNGFWIGETEVTQKAYKRLRGSNPSHFKGDNLPVDSVSWKEASQFCNLLTERQAQLRVGENQTGMELVYILPSEAQWEYACRAGSTGVFYASELGPLAWYFPNSNKTTHPVKRKTPNSWGLFDMLGNVEEWCSDHFVHTYAGAALDERSRQDIATVRRVIRGGSFESLNAKDISSSSRRGAGPSYRYSNTGFRPVMVFRENYIRTSL